MDEWNHSRWTTGTGGKLSYVSCDIRTYSQSITTSIILHYTVAWLNVLNPGRIYSLVRQYSLPLQGQPSVRSSDVRLRAARS